MNFICSALAAKGIHCSQGYDEQLVARFNLHLAQFGISYGTAEEFNMRLEQFKKNDLRIREINAQNGSWTAGHNKFSTLTEDELKRVKGRLNAEETGKIITFDESNLSDSVDWREKGGVNPVQDQGMCGSCWSFASAAGMEGAHFVASGELLKLSEQQFVDCDRQYDQGCNGGLALYAFEYAKTHAIELESDYPYTATDDSCKEDSSKGQVLSTDYGVVQPQSIAQFKAAVADRPIPISVDAGQEFMTYSSGILDSATCGTSLNHAITAVGYGTENGHDYAIIRNSWGAGWGENGYIRMSIDAKYDGTPGVCGMLIRPVAVVTD
jgi:C1A family cysteine protease